MHYLNRSYMVRRLFWSLWHLQAKGPILGAYWDAIAADIINRSVAIVQERKRV